MRQLLSIFWMTANEALEAGMTHHGRLYGIPAWVARDPREPDVLHGCAKVPLLSVLTILLDVLDDAWCRIGLEDGEVHVTPVRMLRPIQAGRGRVTP